MTKMFFVSCSASPGRRSGRPAHLLSHEPLRPLARTSRQPGFCFDLRRAASTESMDLKKPLVLLALVGSLVACGDNTNLDRGETNCDASGQEASNEQDATCEEEGPEDD